MDITPFKGDFPITQEFGNKLIINGVDIYGQWGLKGHNGIDYGIPNDTPLYAPHSGKIIEAVYDKEGYGWYLKIENEIEGSVLAHMRKFEVGLGDEIVEGQLIGYSNNSGWSTGPHLHWGYYRHPRNRNNGYNGFIDQIPYIDTQPTYSDEYIKQVIEDRENLLKEVGEIKTTLKEISDDYEALKEKAQSLEEFKKQVAEKLNTGNQVEDILEELSKAVSCEDNLRKLQKELGEMKNEMVFLQSQVEEEKERYKSLETEKKAVYDDLVASYGKINELSDTNKTQTKTIEQLEWKVEDLKNKPKNKGLLWEFKIFGLLARFFKSV